MTAPTPDPTTASVGEQIAAAIEAKCMGSHRQGTGLCPECADAARIARNFTPTVDGATVDEAAVDLPQRAFEVLMDRVDNYSRDIQRSAVEGCAYAVRDALAAELRAATVPTSPTDTGGTDDGLRKALTALADDIDNQATAIERAGSRGYVDRNRREQAATIRAVLAAHPAPPVTNKCTARHPQPPKNLATCSLAAGHSGPHEVHSIFNASMFSWTEDGAE